MAEKATFPNPPNADLLSISILLTLKSKPLSIESQDSMLTIGQTAQKLDVNAHKYIYDRVSNEFEMPSLASLISAKKTPLIEGFDFDTS